MAAFIYVTEYAEQLVDAGRSVPVPLEPPLAAEAVAVDPTSTQGSVFNAKTTMVEVHAGEVCSIEIGTNPTAVATKRRMAAGETRFFGVPKGKSFRIAAIDGTA